ncbi:hypothetical protein PFICI_02493 [Pestalotiopsis fici W106-1]|uniref:Metallo-beta-lactamase domain-containing protein n=1 Tax=Pestalotiopsis fici (strain W106-1 / CGMCC3.15140) TaxID=1229662 RepID=W3XEE1_PESFW|nr:uncharacterized protein PFICI_02493 [Pestalotiopsis fici W106-1]ETS84468.1 hypothetical protein PFICI_02493 [Pestalotiopsis fici W106-1]
MAETTQSHAFPSGSVAKLSIIETKARIGNIPISAFFGPPLDGYERLALMPAWSFLVESSTGRRIVFDLAMNNNPETVTPGVEKEIASVEATVEIPKTVAQVLSEGGVSLKSIESIVWSHWHIDHVGDPSTFPDTPEIVVGPGAKEAILPTYPENEDSQFHEKMMKGKTLREVVFDGSLKFYDFDAVDFFGDGSFYLIDLPGHALGHIGGVVRTTTNPDTFAVLSGDLYHIAGELRPNVQKPLPAHISLAPPRGNTDAKESTVYPRSALERLQTARGRDVDEPFFEVVSAVAHDAALANEMLKKAQIPDALENILFLAAHDDALIDVANFFPDTANNWKELGWKKRLEWAFLTHFAPSIQSQVGA